MNNVMKARLIVELLDDRKYPILSSCSQTELSKINSANLDEIKDLSRGEINAVVSEFIAAIEKSKVVEEDVKEEEKETEAKKADEPIEKKKKKKKGKKDEDTENLDIIIEKIQSQPLQVIACAINRFDEEQKEYIISNLPEEKKQGVVSIDVEDIPVSSQVMDLIIKELELNI